MYTPTLHFHTVLHPFDTRHTFTPQLSTLLCHIHTSTPDTSLQAPYSQSMLQLCILLHHTHTPTSPWHHTYTESHHTHTHTRLYHMHINLSYTCTPHATCTYHPYTYCCTTPKGALTFHLPMYTYTAVAFMLHYVLSSNLILTIERDVFLQVDFSTYHKIRVSMKYAYISALSDVL